MNDVAANASDLIRTLEWNADEWRDARDAKLAEWLQDPDAARFFVDLSHFVEVFDDYVDADVPVKKEDMAHAVLAVLYYIPANPFFVANRTSLLPHLFMCTNAWLDSNDLCTGDTSDKALAYTLKGMGVDVLLACITITRGVVYMRSVSVEVRRLFMAYQPFADYLKEQDHVV